LVNCYNKNNVLVIYIIVCALMKQEKFSNLSCYF